MSDYLVRYENHTQIVERELDEADFFSTMWMIERAGFSVIEVLRLKDSKDLSVVFSNKEGK